MKGRGWSSCGGGDEGDGGWGFGEVKNEVKKGLEMKRKSIYRFWICEGGEIKIEERGLFAKWGVRCLSWPMVAGQGEG